MKEHVLHIALRTPQEKQPALELALRSIAAVYDEVDWLQLRHPGVAVLAMAQKSRPTLIFMQLQREESLFPPDITAIRAASDPSVVIISWDGDQHHEPNSRERRWFVELGRVCDASLVVNTRHPAEYAALGVKNPGYLQIGIDEKLYRPMAKAEGTPPIVMLASRYATHCQRNAIVHKLMERYGEQFGIYGHGWSGPSARPMLCQNEEAGVYAAARCAISMSIRHDLPCYTSDRLFRAMGSGAITLVEGFPGMEALGLVPAENCFTWGSFDGLCGLIDYVLSSDEKDWVTMRLAAVELVFARHTWRARMPDLLDIVERVRRAR